MEIFHNNKLFFFHSPVKLKYYRNISKIRYRNFTLFNWFQKQYGFANVLNWPENCQTSDDSYSHKGFEKTKSVETGKLRTHRLLAARLLADLKASSVVGHFKIAQMESMFVGHFEFALNPYKFWRTQNQVNVLHTHTLSYLMPIFERFLMTPLSARSTLVILTLKKNLNSNGSKPIGILKTRNLRKRENREPIGYSLPDFKPHWSNVFHSLHFFFNVLFHI